MKLRSFAALLSVVLALFLLSCGADDGIGDPSLAPSVDGPVLRLGLPFATEAEDAEVKGVLEIADGCIYLVWAETAQRIPVVWPASTAWDPEAASVVLPNGDVVGDGDRVYGGGGYRHVERVRLIAGDTIADRADQCAGNPTSEVAVINNQPNAVALDS